MLVKNSIQQVIIHINYEILCLKLLRRISFTVHIVTRDSADFQLYNEVMNLIKGGSRISNIYTFLENDYTENGSSICYPITADCTLFITVEVTFSIILDINLVSRWFVSTMYVHLLFRTPPV